MVTIGSNQEIIAMFQKINPNDIVVINPVTN